ncbi:MAG: hypothetical protein NT167_23385 [Verrucomicrobia bacterium]|nr:hypothetical protein [Verrucomicrobiota bacterium]
MAAKQKLRGPKRNRAPQKRPRWDELDLRTIFKIYAKTSNLELARRFGRTVQAVASLGHVLGLKKHPSRLLLMGQQNIARRWHKPKGHPQPATGRRGTGRRKLASK